MIIMPYCYSQFMMNLFCKKSSVNNNYSSCLASPSKCGLGLITNETPRVPNVIESSSVVIKPMTSSSPPHQQKQPERVAPPPAKKDPGGIGFIDDMGGGVDGLMSCTESLGFESCDERRVDDDDDHHDDIGNDHHNMQLQLCGGKRRMMTTATTASTTRDAWRRRRRRSEEKKERNKRKFPPPLSSLNQNGQPCFYLKPVRNNGRLELTEVKIQRPEILRAVRQNGRLRLHLVSSDEHVCPKTIEEAKEEEEELDNVIHEETKQQEEEQELHLQEEEEEEDKEEEKVEELWKYRSVSSNGEGLRRCHHHIPNINNHHHSLHVWRQPCVTTR